MNNLNQFLTIALNKDIQVESIISSNKSESTNSYYFVIKTTDNDMLRLALSDHYASNHDEDIFDVANDMDEDFEEFMDELAQTTGVDDELSLIIDDMGNYGIEIIDKYNLNTSDLIGQYSINRAFLKVGYIIKDAKLTEDDRILTVTYDDGDVRQYVNYDPSDDLADGSDIAIITYLLDNYDVHQARGIYYNHQVSAETETELMDSFDDEDIDIKDALTDQQELVTVDGNNYVVDYAALVL